MSKKEKADIWMPLYIGDYLADTTRLTTEQHGAYLLLIMDYWRSGKLPDNDAVLSQITRMSPNAWSNARAMLEQFFTIDDGFWTHSRIDKELEAAQKNKDAASLKAAKAAFARWNKDNNDAPSNATSMPQAMHEGMLEQCPSPLPSPLPTSVSLTPDNKTAKRTKRHTTLDVLEAYGITGQLAKDFSRQRSKPITQTAMEGIRKEAEKAGIPLEEAIRVAVVRGWQSFNADWIKRDKPKEELNWDDWSFLDKQAAQKQPDTDFIDITPTVLRVEK